MVDWPELEAGVLGHGHEAECREGSLRVVLWRAPSSLRRASQRWLKTPLIDMCDDPWYRGIVANIPPSSINHSQLDSGIYTITRSSFSPKWDAL